MEMNIVENNVKKFKNIKRGNIIWAKLEGHGSVTQGVRPLVVVGNNKGNAFSPVILCTPITSRIKKKLLPTQVFIEGDKSYGLKKDGIIMAEQLVTVDKASILDVAGSLPYQVMESVNKALKISLAL